ncbi:hypothetical protein DF19_28770 [Streptomyces olindensis]|nr:hypothetical protein DF19_28770 [Streptomyces olindensis]
MEGDAEAELRVGPVVAVVVEFRQGGAEVLHGAVQITQPLADRARHRVPQLPFLRPEIVRRALRGPVPHRTQDPVDEFRRRHPKLHQFRQLQPHLAPCDVRTSSGSVARFYGERRVVDILIRPAPPGPSRLAELGRTDGRSAPGPRR